MVNAHFDQINNVSSRATVRTHRLTVDRATTKGGHDEGPSGGEYLLVGLGGCFTSHLLAAIQARNADVTEVRVSAQAEMGGTPERFTSFVLAVTAKCDDAELARKLVTVAARGCQVVNTLRLSAPITVSYNGDDVPFGNLPPAASLA